MAREKHRMQAPAFRHNHHRKSPKWYQQHTTPFYTSRPSARMEKQLAEEADRQWQSQNTTEGIRKRSIKASCTPWISYAQTSARLRLALKGHDAVNLPDEGEYNTDCTTFVCCLPFYGVLVAKLQSTIRAVYDIDGSEARDWQDGCCCPCFALVRAENEIIFRESRNFQEKDAEKPEDVSEPSEETYMSQPPMEVLAPMSTQTTAPPHAPSSSTSSSKGKGIDRSSKPLSTIPEVSREVSGAGVTADDGPSRHTIKKAIKPHALTDDETVPLPVSKTAFPLLNYLDKQWVLVPASDLKENAKPDEPAVKITDDGPIELKRTDRGMWSFFRRSRDPKDTEPVTKHALEADARSSRTATITSKHALAEDVPVVQSHKSRFAEHLLGNDHVSPSTVPAINVTHITHELSDDPVFSLPTGSGAGKHLLSEHQLDLAGRAATSPTHGLQGDEQANPSPEAPSHPRDEMEKAPQDKGFIATVLSGMAEPLRTAQSSSAIAETSERAETSELPGPHIESGEEETVRVMGHDIADDEVFTR